MNWRTLFALGIFAKAIHGADFYQPAPAQLEGSLGPQLPVVLEMLAGDPDLIRDAGAGSRAALMKARFDFAHTARLHDIDYRSLDRADGFSELVYPTHQYAVPICVGDQCQTMALVTWQPGTETKVQYVGRHYQQAAFQEAAQRVAATSTEAPAKLVATDVMNYVYIPEAQGGGYLVSATAEQERRLAEMVHQPLLAKNAAPWKMQISHFKAVVETRSAQYDASHLDDFRRPEVVSPDEVPPGATMAPETASKTPPAKPLDAEQITTEQTALPSAPSPASRNGLAWRWSLALLVGIIGLVWFRHQKTAN